MQELIPVGGIYWLVPVACSCLMIGLSLDYDVFLISSIYELRHAGFSTEAAILRAMGTESTTITTAGLIMTVAFSSLMLRCAHRSICHARFTRARPRPSLRARAWRASSRLHPRAHRLCRGPALPWAGSTVGRL